MKNQTKRYLKYALGEIILVVIGILVALQINNWNENRKERFKETKLLEEIHSEFIKNQQQFKARTNGHKLIINSCQNLIDVFPIQLKPKELPIIAKNIEYSLRNFTFNPSQGTVNSVISSSSFNIIQNDTLRKLLISWKDLVDDYMEQEKVASDFFYNDYYLFIMDNFNLSGNLSDSRNNFAVLKTLEFENMVRRRQLSIESFFKNGKVDNIEKAIDEIVRLSKSE